MAKRRLLGGSSCFAYCDRKLYVWLYSIGNGNVWCKSKYNLTYSLFVLLQGKLKTNNNFNEKMCGVSDSKVSKKLPKLMKE
jgi:hypothetical protein